MTAGSSPIIVLLNGVGSAGKTSIARALQAIAARPLLHVQMDTFLEMLPPALANHPESFTFSPLETPAGPEVAIQSGPLGDRLMRAMRLSVRAMAEQGLNIVVDDVLMGAGDPGVAAYRQLLAPFDFRMVGVLASLDTLEARERQRGDRMIGLARWQYERVHNTMIYDLEVHTDTDAPESIARAIQQSFGL